MNYRVLLSARAEQDVDETLAWISHKGSVSGAGRWLDRLLAAIDTLERDPMRFGLASEAADVGIELRQLPLGRRPNIYRVFFVLDQRTVTILHIRHAARDTLRPEDLR